MGETSWFLAGGMASAPIPRDPPPPPGYVDPVRESEELDDVDEGEANDDPEPAAGPREERRTATR